jgi:hypothetical protein
VVLHWRLFLCERLLGYLSCIGTAEEQHQRGWFSEIFLVLLSIRTSFPFVCVFVCVCERKREREFFEIIFLNVLSIHSIPTGFGGGWCVQF